MLAGTSCRAAVPSPAAGAAAGLPDLCHDALPALRHAGHGADEPTGPAFKPVSLKPKHLGKHPEYIHDPEAPKIEAEHAKRKAEIARLNQTGAWKPNAGYKTDMVRSVVRMNIR